MVLAHRIAHRDRRTKRRQVAMTTTHRISTTAALVLSRAAAGAPAASARPVGPDTAGAAKVQSSNTAVRPNADQQTATGTTGGTSGPVYSRQDKAIVGVTS